MWNWLIGSEARNEEQRISEGKSFCADSSSRRAEPSRPFRKRVMAAITPRCGTRRRPCLGLPCLPLHPVFRPSRRSCRRSGDLALQRQLSCVCFIGGIFEDSAAAAPLQVRMTSSHSGRRLDER